MADQSIEKLHMNDSRHVYIGPVMVTAEEFAERVDTLRESLELLRAAIYEMLPFIGKSKQKHGSDQSTYYDHFKHPMEDEILAWADAITSAGLSAEEAIESARAFALSPENKNAGD